MTSDFARRAYGSFGRLGPGQRIAGYLIEEQIGAGGMAVVFRARDEVLGRAAAVKVIAPSMADDEEFRARFLHESRAAAAVDSLHIVPVYAAGEADGLLYIATRFVAGGDLSRLLRRAGGRLAADRVAALVSQVASALDAAHAAGLVHRDVKPQNILIDSVPERAEHAYLSDFGLSKRTASTGLTATGQFLGTPDYCAPEQIRAAYVDGRVDQYALGCVAFVLLTGELPFRRNETVATLFAHLQDPVPPVTRSRPDLPAAVDGVIARAMAKSPAERYARCGEFAAVLREALVPARPAGPGRWGGPAREEPPSAFRDLAPWERPAPSRMPLPTSATPPRPSDPPSPRSLPTAGAGALGSQLSTKSQLPRGADWSQATGPGGFGGFSGPTGPGPSGPRGPQGGRRKHPSGWRGRWTRKQALALASAAVAVLVLAVFGVYEGMSGGTASHLVADGYTTVYYSDGTTVLGQLGDPSPPAKQADPWVPYLLTEVENELTGVDGVSEQKLDDGGLTVVTTISRPMEAEMYKAVDDDLAAASISGTKGATVSPLPSWALVGAELQDPKTGQILAEYPGKGQDMSAAQCKIAECDVNTAAYAREQVGSSFSPYVLATAVSEGLNVKTSVLNASPALCVPPDTKPLVLSTDASYAATKCSQADYFPVTNDGGQVIGDPAKNGATTVQNALARSSDAAFTDLAHRAGTASIAKTAGEFGVDVAPYTDGGSGLSSYVGEVAMALGVAPLTVNEQDTMLSTIADDGQYHQAHLVKSWQYGADDPVLLPKVAVRTVLSAALDAQVQYAMEDTTIHGAAAATVGYGRGAPGTVIGVTGATANSRTGFFLGATTQYSLVVGMFTGAQVASTADSLAALGGGGYGGYWPSKIWNTFAEAEFAQRPSLFATKPAFTGGDWNQVGKGAATGAASTSTGITTGVPTVTCTVNGKQETIDGDSCPTPTPTPTCTTYQQYEQDGGQCTTAGATPTSTSTCSYDAADGQYDICTTSTPPPTPTPITTCSYDAADGQYDICNGNGNGL